MGKNLPVSENNATFAQNFEIKLADNELESSHSSRILINRETAEISGFLFEVIRLGLKILFANNLNLLLLKHLTIFSKHTIAINNNRRMKWCPKGVQ